MHLAFPNAGLSRLSFFAIRNQPDYRLARLANDDLLNQMITAHNFAPGNAGVIFYTDILIPIIGFALLSLQFRLSISRSK